jgi:hypothetical protein
MRRSPGGRPLRSALALLTVSLSAAVMSSGPARADTSVTQGWWTITNPGAPVPGLTPASDVPSDGFEVAGSSSNPTAFAALAFDFDSQSTVGQLTLHVADGAVVAPNSSVKACALSASFEPAQGGSMSDAPKYDCSTGVAGKLDATSNTVTFAVSSLAQSGSLAVAIVPAGQNDRVVFNMANSADLETTPAPPSEESPADFEDQQAALPDTSSSPYVDSTLQASAPLPSVSPRASTPTPSPSGNAPAAADTSLSFATSRRGDDGGRPPVVGAVLVLLLAVTVSVKSRRVLAAALGGDRVAISWGDDHNPPTIVGPARFE